MLPWRHTHQFAPAGQRATRVTTCRTPLPPGYSGRCSPTGTGNWPTTWPPRRAPANLPGPAHDRGHRSSGLIGTALTALLTTGGHHVIRLVRRPPRHAGSATGARRSRADLLNGVDAVIHLAGASIAGRFTPGRKQGSATAGSSRPAAWPSSPRPAPRLERRRHRGPAAFVTASAIGIYGPDRGDEVLTETSARGDGFLADVVTAWEDATTPAARAGLRTVQVRTGIVQTPRGGMLRLLYPLFAAGLGGRLGSGQQWLSWIGLDDLLDIYLRAVTDPSFPARSTRSLPRRCATPYTTTLACRCTGPPGARARFAPRLLLGAEGPASRRGQPVRPRAAAVDAGHHFRHPELEAALRHVLGREPAVVPAIQVPVGAE